MRQSHTFEEQYGFFFGAWFGSVFAPNGWLDALRQLALFAGAYYAYRLVRGFVDGQAGLAFENARNLVALRARGRALLRARACRPGRAARTGSSPARTGCT